MSSISWPAYQGSDTCLATTCTHTAGTHRSEVTYCSLACLDHAVMGHGAFEDVEWKQLTDRLVHSAQVSLQSYQLSVFD